MGALSRIPVRLPFSCNWPAAALVTPPILLRVPKAVKDSAENLTVTGYVKSRFATRIEMAEALHPINGTPRPVGNAFFIPNRYDTQRGLGISYGTS